jgi:hypothetical protein
MKDFFYSILAASAGVICAYLLLALVMSQMPVGIGSLGYVEQKASQLVLIIGGCIGLLVYALWGDDE